VCRGKCNRGLFMPGRCTHWSGTSERERLRGRRGGRTRRRTYRRKTMGHRYPLGSGSAGQGRQRPLAPTGHWIRRAGFRVTGPRPCTAGPAYMPVVDPEATLGHTMEGGWSWERGGQTMHMPLQAHFGPTEGRNSVECRVRLLHRLRN
jgi:hypothetical protein